MLILGYNPILFWLEWGSAKDARLFEIWGSFKKAKVLVMLLEFWRSTPPFLKVVVVAAVVASAS